MRAIALAMLVLITPRAGAAQTQGIALPPLKRFTSNFSHLRAYCGDAEVTPIHRFTIEHGLSEKDAIQEGLYVFDPRAFGTQCAIVRFVLYSEKEPEKGDTRTVDPKLLQQLADDFSP